MWDFMKNEKALFIVFAVLMGLNIITLIIIWPYVWVRGCCKCKQLSLSFILLTFEQFASRTFQDQTTGKLTRCGQASGT